MRRTGLTAIGITALVAGVVLILVAHSAVAAVPDQDALWNILRDFGIAFAGAGLVAVTVDRGTALHIRRQMSEFIDQLRGDIIFAGFARVVPPELAQEIRQHVIEDRILYKRFSVDNTFRESADNNEILEGDSTAHVVVVNDCEQSSEWSYHMRISDLATGAPSPNTVVQFAVRSNMNSANNKVLHESELQDEAQSPNEEGVLVLKKSFTLLPHEELEVEISRRIQVKRRDTYNLAVRHPTVESMKLRVNLPAGYKVDHRFAHPGLDDHGQCTFRQATGNVATAEIRGGVLPYQGVTVSWDPPTEKPNAKTENTNVNDS